jgi:hypothetical protein
MIKEITNCKGKHNKLWMLYTDKNKRTSHPNPQQTKVAQKHNFKNIIREVGAERIDLLKKPLQKSTIPCNKTIRSACQLH